MRHSIILNNENFHQSFKYGRLPHVTATMVYEYCPTTDGTMWLASFKDACDALEYAKRVAGDMEIINEIKKEK